MYNTISDTVQCLCCVSPRKPLASQDLIFVEGKSISDVDNPEDSIARVAYNTVILNQTFDDEQIGDVPKNWTITQPQYGSFTIDNQTCYSGGRSAKFVDNSTVGSPCPYRTFRPQNGTIAVTFAIRLNASSGITSYSQEAPNQSIIWDRVNITLAIQNDRIKVGENATITWSGTYEYGGTFIGSLILNDTQTQYTTPGARGYTTPSISDPVHGLKAFTSNSITCTWEEAPFWTQWAFLMIVAVVTAIGGGILTTLVFWTMRAHKRS